MVETMSRYVGLAERDESGWWVGTVAGLPGAITQAEHLADLQANIAEAIWALTEEETAPEDVALTVVLDSVPAAAAELGRAG
jgi:predicted RNase H-like HicB family nuclease